MTNAEEDGLHLTEPAKSLWATIRNRLAELQHAHEETPETWMMGGGSVLAARWRHRRSTDIDLITSAGWQIRGLENRGRNDFTNTMRALGGRLDGYNQAAVEMTFPGRKRLHVFRSEPSPTLGHVDTVIDEHRFDALSTIQILAGKLLNRSLRAPARDLYDIVIASEREPAGLHRAVNMLSPDMQGDIAVMWHVRREKIERDARWNLKPLSSSEPLLVSPGELVERAGEVLRSACYQEIEIEPAGPGQPARIITTTEDGKSEPIIVPRARIEETLEWTGINGCLRVRQLDRSTFVGALHAERE